MKKILKDIYWRIIWKYRWLRHRRTDIVAMKELLRDNPHIQ